LSNGSEIATFGMTSKNRPYMKKHFAVLLVALLAATLSCSRKELHDSLLDIESYISDSPERALASLDSLKASGISGRENAARFALLYSMALDKNYIDITSDSIITTAVRWYSSHGSPDDRLKAFYYRAVISQNAGDNESAMEWFVRAEAEAPGAKDNVAKGMLYRAMSYVYACIFDMEQSEKYINLAKTCYKESGDTDKYAGALIYSANIRYSFGQYQKAQECLDSVSKLWPAISEPRQNEYYILKMRLLKEADDKSGLSETISEYMHSFDNAAISWLDIAEFEIYLGHHDRAAEILNTYKAYHPEFKDDPIYYMTYGELHEATGAYQKALEDQIRYSDLMDSLNLEVARHDTGFLKERYEKELRIERERNIRTIVILTSAFGIAALAAILLHLRKRLRSKKAEAAAYRSSLDELRTERDSLAAALAENPPVDRQSLAVINDRLNLLNRLFAEEISPRALGSKNPFAEIQRIVENREEFLYTTRMTLAAAHPDFISFLEGRGLSLQEIEYCCLYAIGLRGTDISRYFGHAGHYNASSSIRAKLGLGPHDTNLGIFLRSKL